MKISVYRPLIITSLCHFLSSKSQQAYSRGHYAQAEDLNEKATQWAVLGIVVGTVLTLIAAGAAAGIIYWQVTNTANL